MLRNVSLSLVVLCLLTSCITVSLQSETEVPPIFVTSTLPPTRSITPRPTAAWLPALTTEVGRPVEPTPCEDRAVLLADVTFPDNASVPAGQVFTKTWRFMNTGTCPWTGYTIHFETGDRLNAPESALVPDTAPGGTVDLSVELTAPQNDGIYTTHFALQDAAGRRLPIGTERTFYARVRVGSAFDSSGVAPGPILLPAGGTPAVSVGSLTLYCRYSYVENAGYVQELTARINQARTEAGLSTLAWNPVLAEAAQAHSIDMACNNFLSHAGSDGSRFGGMAHALGYFSIQEIIAIGTPQNAMDQWYADPGHWEIVLNPLATELGVGYAYNANSDYGGYFTVDLH